ncbi:GTP-binding protein [Pelagibius sp. Alg239-R121]|uniref:CobW family GTP-binding protein n=1 Tax=Pelagibius sp. Alg239-R121 TaxID=2993448 RepID=UPI0024A615BB|nr:GTP-binding protein [Pelagibius sp. Alg239-R121]
MIPVNIVTGFLGSGKTTLLREILQRPDFSDTAVIVNEFGEIGLDHILLEEVEEGVLLLESGCICCTIRSDLQETIRGLQEKAAKGVIAPFRRIVIETTGLADPAPIVSTIAAEPVIRNHFRNANIICTLDAVNGLATLAQQPEATKQLAVADRILITKTDMADEAAVDALETRVDAINAIAVRGRSTGADFEAQLLFAEDIGDAGWRSTEIVRWLQDDATKSHESAHDHHHSHGHTASVHSFTVSYPRPIDWTAFGVWLTALLHAHGERILRVKGILNVRESETPVVIQGVQHVVHPPMHLGAWPDDGRDSRIVFIVRDIDETAIRRSLIAFLEMAARLTDEALAV